MSQKHLLSSLNTLILLTWRNQYLPLVLLGQFHEQEIRSFRLIVKSSIKNSMFLTHVNGVNVLVSCSGSSWHRGNDHDKAYGLIYIRQQTERQSVVCDMVWRGRQSVRCSALVRGRTEKWVEETRRVDCRVTYHAAAVSRTDGQTVSMGFVNCFLEVLKWRILTPFTSLLSGLFHDFRLFYHICVFQIVL